MVNQFVPGHVAGSLASRGGINSGYVGALVTGQTSDGTVIIWRAVPNPVTVMLRTLLLAAEELAEEASVRLAGCLLALG